MECNVKLDIQIPPSHPLYEGGSTEVFSHGGPITIPTRVAEQMGEPSPNNILLIWPDRNPLPAIHDSIRTTDGIQLVRPEDDFPLEVIMILHRVPIRGTRAELIKDLVIGKLTLENPEPWKPPVARVIA